MKKLLFLAAALCCAFTAQAQNEIMTAILQHGEDATAFTGMNALVQAHEAAADGDVITLSEGSFNPVTITKSVSIYGAGFETDETAGTTKTLIAGELKIGVVSQTLSDVRLEGLYINGHLSACYHDDANVEGLVVTKCYVNGNIRFYGTSTNTEISSCVVNGSVAGHNGWITASLQVSNTHVAGNFNTFSADCSVNADHCIICADYGGAILYTNCVLANFFTPGSAIADGSVVKNCLCYRGAPSGNKIVENCYVEDIANMFTDAQDASYSATRTFELQQPDVWMGNDGTQVGINGGKGFSKVPATPVVKNMKLNVEGKQLKVDYEAGVR